MKELNISIIEDISEDTVNILNSIVSNHCKELDTIVKQIKEIINASDDDLTDNDIEDILLRLPIAIYSVSDMQEIVGIKSDISEALVKEKYNNAYQSYEGKVGEKSAHAELTVQQDKIVTDIFIRAYKIIKSKVESAYELLNSVKRVQTRRMQYTDMKGD